MSFLIQKKSTIYHANIENATLSMSLSRFSTYGENWSLFVLEILSHIYGAKLFSFQRLSPTAEVSLNAFSNIFQPKNEERIAPLEHRSKELNIFH